MRANIPKGMGGGPQNMNAMIKQAQKMQEDMEALQAELDEREYDSSWSTSLSTVTPSITRSSLLPSVLSSCTSVSGSLLSVRHCLHS